MCELSDFCREFKTFFDRYVDKLSMSVFKCLRGGVRLIGRDSASPFEVAMDVGINVREVKSGAVRM